MTREDQLIAEWRQNVLQELKYFRENMDEVKKNISDLKEDNATINSTLKQLSKQIESHPSGCPINRKGIEEIVDVQLQLYTANLPSKRRKILSEILTIITAIIAIMAFVITLMNQPADSSETTKHLRNYKDTLITNKTNHYE